jgi:lipoyl(octanoyl) transferase
MNKPEWRISDGAVPYAEALAVMEARVADIHAGRERELVWLLEHPPLYTAGTSSKPQDLLQPMRFPVHVAGRGGQYTYHGPGQRVIYAMLDLRGRRQDVRRFVFDLEEWTLRTLARFSVTAERRTGRVGVWVARPDKPSLPDGSPARTRSCHRRPHSSLGVLPRHFDQPQPDLSHYAGIVPCGIADHGVTSLVDLDHR